MKKQPEERQAWFYSDLVKLRELLFDFALTQADIRTVIAGTLRRHFVENELDFVSRELGYSPKIATVDTEPSTRAIRSHGDVVYWQHARANISGKLVHSILVAATRQPPESNSPGDLFPGGNPDAAILLNSNQFRDQKIAFASGNFVSRGDVIKFFANKLGGVHVDQRRKTPLDVALEEMRGQLILPLHSGEVIDGLQVEVLAMAQCYLMSSDIKLLFSTLHSKFQGRTY